MNRVPVTSFGFAADDYDSPEAAIRGALQADGQECALRDTKRIDGATLERASWSKANAVLQFSNATELRVYLEGHRVAWELGERGHDVDAPSSVDREPVIHGWGGSVGDVVYEPTALIAKRLNRPIRRLFVCEGLMVYFQSLPILWFRSIEYRDTRSLALYMSETD